MSKRPAPHGNRTLKEHFNPMNVTVERPNPAEAVMTIEVDEEQLEQAKDRAYKEYAKYLRVPGFRPGKAPRQIVEQMVDADAVMRRARELAIGPAYRAALEQSELVPYDQGTVDEISEDDDKPLTFKATVPLRPEAELGSYDGLKARRVVHTVTDEEVRAEVDRLLARHAHMEPTTEPAQDGDVVFADLDTSVEGEALGNTRSATFTVGQNMTELDAAMRGAKGGDTVETDIEYPADFADPNLAGKVVHFTLRINHILHKVLPELNDAWVAEHTIASDVEELFRVLRVEMEKNAEKLAEQDLRGQLLSQVVERATVHFPSQLVDREVADDLRILTEDLATRDRTLEQYLESIQKTLPQLQDEMAIAARQRITNGLVMGRIAQTENLEVTREELDAEIERIAAENDMKAKEARRRLKAEGQLENLHERMLQDKLFSTLR